MVKRKNRQLKKWVRKILRLEKEKKRFITLNYADSSVGLRMETTGIWQGQLKVIKNGKETHSVFNDGTQNLTLNEVVKKKDSLQIKFEGVKSENLGIEIKCEPR